MIIRKFKHPDTEEIIEIWYNVSVVAHSFIPKEMWESHKDELRNKYLPIAETWVAEENGNLIGFISLLGNYIGALFITPKEQGKGVGTKLIEQARREKGHLNVGVYSKNIDAGRFYKKNGFAYLSEEVQPETGEVIINMTLE
ncbi:putative P-loop ATPase fused to an acetyltransferase [Desulfitobacterium dichloroeliminans LMG P-21439]|uniref:Putative P-loop ATPase fused to an acetyltransferase n=1 Tax=Desulfitobacterium dichloroeliminans (strain LMG P-21439 / DCA1) TaxID=871963 RepID=L0F2Z9_DESDL|nr:GNAT family N-acetyltransferase [Desulfitobacterium dichloroeliminans]AGA68224.1 putative P-loop ATPase fused to an acetyltransferase [Desulfitobacterium dichloroeliminans LMG P-21439]